MTAQMADQAVLRTVQREGKAAVRAGADMAALLAEHGCGKPASVEKKDDLLSAFQAL